MLPVKRKLCVVCNCTLKYIFVIQVFPLLTKSHVLMSL